MISHRRERLHQCFKSLSITGVPVPSKNLTQLFWQDVAISSFRRLKNLDWKRSARGRDGLPHSCCQLLHCSFALFCFLLWAPQHVPQLLQVVQCAHQLTFHCLHLTLQHLCVMQRIPPVASAGAHFFLQVLYCNDWSNAPSYSTCQKCEATNFSLWSLPMFSW